MIKRHLTLPNKNFSTIFKLCHANKCCNMELKRKKKKKKEWSQNYTYNFKMLDAKILKIIIIYI
jgi:hypothetical protein